MVRIIRVRAGIGFFLLVLWATTGCLPAGGGADFQADEFPSRKIQVIVPYAAGGGTDQTARMMAEGFPRVFGVPAYVTNRVGGGGVRGHFGLSHATPDGYTIGIMTVEIVAFAHLGMAQINQHDFEPIILHNLDAAALSVPTQSPIQTLEDFFEAARQRPLTVGCAGTGGIWHLAAAGVAAAAGVTLRFVPYTGAAPTIRAVLGGEVEALCVSAVEARPQIEGNTLRCLAVMSDERLDFLPDVPTLKEGGIDFTVGSWRGVGAPKGTPPEIVEKLAAGLKTIYDSPEFTRMMTTAGFGMVYMGPSEFSQFMNRQSEQLGLLIRDLGLAE